MALLLVNWVIRIIAPFLSIISINDIHSFPLFPLPFFSSRVESNIPFIHIIVQWVIERDERVRNAQAAFDANQKEIARLQAFVDR